MKEKICPILLNGIAANGNGELAMKEIFIAIQTKNIKVLPHCLKEGCALWISEGMLEGHYKIEGYCGLRR